MLPSSLPRTSAEQAGIIHFFICFYSKYTSILIHNSLRFSFLTNQMLPQYVSPILSIIYNDTESIIHDKTLVKIRFHFH